jgi:phosphatidylglycerol:prolipoprotein diacylglycerol transferase
MPWKIFIDPPYRLSGYEKVNFFHPLFAYEVVLNFVNMVFLLWLVNRFSEKLAKGNVFLSYLGVYSLIRFFLEFLRLDVALVYGININQVFFGVVFVFAGAALCVKHRSAQEL